MYRGNNVTIYEISVEMQVHAAHNQFSDIHSCKLPIEAFMMAS